MNLAAQEALKAFYLITLTLSAYACLSLAFNSTGVRRVKLSLLLLCMFMFLLPLNAYLLLAFKQAPAVLIQASLAITWLYGPIVYFCLREISLKPLSYTQMGLHLIPFTGVLALQTLLIPEHNIYQPRAIGIDAYHYLFIQVFGYLAYAFYWFYKNASNAARAAKKCKNSTYYWFFYLVIFLTGLMLYDLILINQIRDGAQFNTELITTIASAICFFVCSISLFALYQPAIFDRLTTNINSNNSHKEVNPSTNTKDIKTELRKVELSTEAATELRNRLTEMVEEYQPHLDPDISMHKLSALLGITSHQLSELLNVHMETSFYEYLNVLRHETAKVLITKHKKLSINDIAYQSGFNNRNSFYKVFKEHTGMTPAIYRKTKIN